MRLFGQSRYKNSSEAMNLQQYALAVHEKSERIGTQHPYTCSRLGEIAYLVLDWFAQGYPEKRIVATLKYFREHLLGEKEYGYSDDIATFLREYTQAKRK